MPYGQATLLDIKKLDAGIGFELIEESIQSAPELRMIPAETIAGTEIKLTVRTDLPEVSFRNYNEGTPRSKSAYEDRVFQTAILDHQVAIDRKLVENALEPVKVLENHMVGALEAAFRHVGRQFYYGSGNDDKGFPGLIAQFMADAKHEVDVAGGSNKTSVWFVRIARESLQFLFGSGTTINMQEDWKLETILDAKSNPYQAWVNWLTGNVGLRLANRQTCVRIKNIGTAEGKTLNDTHMFSAYQKFVDASGLEPTHIFMTGRSQEQLRASRTAFHPTGQPIPMVDNFQGIPIIRTASISNNE
jgi:hypothetical protein